MSFLHLIYKSRLIDLKRRELIREKESAIKLNHGLKPKYNIFDKIRHRSYDFCRFIKQLLFCTWLIPKHSRFNRYLHSLNTDGTFENYLLKSVIGFFAGVLLTYIIYIFLILQLNFSLSGGTFMSSMFGLILTIGLAFSQKVR